MGGCPHKDIRFCPLYHVMHGGPGAGHSCDDGQLGPFGTGCAVARGYDYHAAVARLRIVAPGLVEGLEWAEAAEASRQQRQRNMACAGLHS